MILLSLILSLFTAQASAQMPKEMQDLPPAVKTLLETYYLPPDEFAGKPEMLGIRFADYSSFMKWEQVTVRYRRDTNEMRFVYANPAAVKALAAKLTDYPDGAVFVKVGYFAQEDSAFASSLVPSGPARVQVMVRNKEKYKTTNGWGYGIFDTSGKTFNGDPVKVAKACAACHQIVPDRGYVFSEKMEFSSLVKMAAAQKPVTIPDKDRIKFETVSIAKLAKNSPLRRILGKNRVFQSIQGELRKEVFGGTYNEILPVLLKEAKRSGRPAALVSENSYGFAVASKLYDANEYSKKCPQKDQTPFQMGWTRTLEHAKGNMLTHLNFDTSIVCE